MENVVNNNNEFISLSIIAYFSPTPFVGFLLPEAQKLQYELGHLFFYSFINFGTWYKFRYITLVLAQCGVFDEMGNYAYLKACYYSPCLV